MLYYIIYYYTYIANDIVLYMRPARAHMQHSAAINRPTSCKSSRAYIYLPPTCIRLHAREPTFYPSL
jgi:hypothetical protein